jgi:purine-binding chemotaxis protein CheW
MSETVTATGSETVEANEQTQYLTFFLAEEAFAVGILRVKEIIEYDTVTRIPNVPASIRGVINLRGSVVPVVDLAARFGLGESRVTKRTCVIIVEVEAGGGKRVVMGVTADAVSQVIDLPRNEIEPPPSFGTRVHVDYLKGIGKMGKQFVLLLDVDKVLATDKLLSLPELPSFTGIETAIPSAPSSLDSQSGCAINAA